MAKKDGKQAKDKKKNNTGGAVTSDENLVSGAGGASSGSPIIGNPNGTKPSGDGITMAGLNGAQATGNLFGGVNAVADSNATPKKDPNGNKLPYKVFQYTPEMATLATAPDIPEYNAPRWSNDYLNGIDTSYYTNAVQRYKDYAEGNRATQLGQAEKAQKDALTSAYVTRLQNERKMAENMAMAGIRGGATETAMLNLANQYGQARSAANTDYSNSVNAINQAIDSNIFDYQSDMDARAEEYRQNMGQAQWQADRENYGNQYQANLDRLWNIYNATNDLNMANVNAQNEASKSYYDNLNNAFINKYNAKREDKQNKNANGEFGTVNYYANKYSKTGKKDLKSMEKHIKKQMNQLEKGGVKKKEKDQYNKLKNRLAGIAQARANKPE